MKFKTLLLPLVGLTAITSVMPLTISCGNGNIYDGPVNLTNFIKNRKNFRRLTNYYNEKQEINTTEANENYINAFANNNYVFYDDIFEDMASSSVWDDQRSIIEGSLQINDVSIEPTNVNDAIILSATANLDNVNFEPGEVILGMLFQLGCDGQISFTKVPFTIYFDTELGKWRIRIKTEDLSTLDTWSISANVQATINGGSGPIEGTFDKEFLETPILGYALSLILSWLSFDLYYYKGIGYSD